LVASMLLGFVLRGCGFEDFNERQSDLHVLDVAGLHTNDQQFIELVELLGSEFDLDHIRRQCRKRRAPPQPKPAPPAATSAGRSSRAGAEEPAATTAAEER
jgi:hypothetical protein